MGAKQLRSFFSRACSALIPVADQERETSRPREYVALEREVNRAIYDDTTVPLAVGSLEDYCRAIGVDPRMVRR